MKTNVGECRWMSAKDIEKSSYFGIEMRNTLGINVLRSRLTLIYYYRSEGSITSAFTYKINSLDQNPNIGRKSRVGTVSANRLPICGVPDRIEKGERG
jgi:hypothetical protein